MTERHDDDRERQEAGALDDGAPPWCIPLTLVIEEHPTWIDDGRYFGTCTINGTRHHIELIPATPEWESHIEELMLFDGADGFYRTIEAQNGTEFVCAITPYCV